MLRHLTRILLILGGLASVYTVLVMGRDNPSIILMAMFVVWVLLPYVVLLAAVGARGRTSPGDGALLVVAILMTAVTLCIYGWVTYGGVPIRKPARFFLLVPFVSLLLAVPLALRARRTN